MMSSNLIGELNAYCTEWSHALANMTEMESRIEYSSAELSRLLRRKDILVELLCSLVMGDKYPDIKKAMMFDNEFLLYSDPNRLFSLRLFIWEPGEYTSIHDHNSWGVIGPVSGEFEVVNYRRNGNAESGSAVLQETERLCLLPGETTSTLPLDDGIHKVGNPTAESILSLSIYGNALPRGYINEFDPATGEIRPLYAPQVKKKLLAIRALPDLDKSRSEDVLKQKREDRLEIIRTASLSALEKLR